MKNWLDWNDNEEKFLQSDHVSELYSWMIPSGDDASGTPKLPEAKNIRDLATIISDESALNVLRGDEGTLSRALARYEVDHPEDWYPKVMSATTALKSLTPDMLRAMDDNTLTALNDLKSRIDQALSDRKQLIGE